MVRTYLYLSALVPPTYTTSSPYQIAALSILHENEIVHRDIKPDNFLVDPAGGVVLTDFGLSLEIDLYGVINGVCGTVDYLAPEQWRGSSYDSQVDVWQLGCTFIELFARLRGTWMGTFGRGNNPLSRVDISLEELQEVLDRSIQEILPENHPAKDLVLMVSPSLSVRVPSALMLKYRSQMIKLHPGDRATVEELKTYPWFQGINWHEVAYGPTAERTYIYLCCTPHPCSSPCADIGSFKPRDVPINPYCSPDYATLLEAASKPKMAPAEEEAVEMQMAMYDVEPSAFVHPPLEPSDFV